MKKKISLFLISLFLISSCNLRVKDTSNDPTSLLARYLIRNSLYRAINSDLPSNLSVSVPRSIRKSATGSASVRGGIRKDLADDLVSSGFTGLSILQDSTTIISLILQEAKRDLILISGVYATAKANPGTCYKGGAVSVEIGEEANTEMLNGLKSLGLSDTEAEASLQFLQSRGTLPSPGQSIPSPALVYRTPTDKNYDNEVNLSVADSLTTAQNCPTNPIASNFQKTIRWNNEKTRIFSSVTKSINVFGNSLTITGSITYLTEAGKKDKAVLNIEQKSRMGRGVETTSTLKFNLQECETETTANLNNCTILNLSSTNENGTNTPIKLTIKGKTDDLGGYVKSTYNDTSQNQDYTFEEYYNSSKEIVWLKIDDGTGPVTYGEIDPALASVYNIGNFTIENSVPITVSSGNLSAEEFFVLVLDGSDPNQSEDFILGTGEVLSDGTINVVYYGTEEDKSGLKIWKLEYDTNTNDFKYTNISGSII